MALQTWMSARRTTLDVITSATTRQAAIAVTAMRVTSWTLATRAPATDSTSTGTGRYVGFWILSPYDDVVSEPYSSIFAQFAASATHVLVSVLMVKLIHISGFSFAFIDDDSRV